jgi:hypothetical protein
MDFHLFALLHSGHRLALWKIYKVAQKWKFTPKVEIADMPKMGISTFALGQSGSQRWLPKQGSVSKRWLPK